MQKRRPATVTVATILMAIIGLGYLITGAALFGQAGRAGARAGELSGGLMENFAASATGVVAVLTIVVGLTLLGTANAIRAGSQAGRIVAWVVMGLLLFCGLGGARSGAPDLGGNVQIRVWQSDGSVRRQLAAESLPEAYSTTYRIVSGTFAVFAMIAMIVAIVLLTRPSAGRWFRPAATPTGPPPGYHPMPYAQTGPFAAPPPAMPYGVAQPSARCFGRRPRPPHRKLTPGYPQVASTSTYLDGDLRGPVRRKLRKIQPCGRWCRQTLETYGALRTRPIQDRHQSRRDGGNEAICESGMSGSWNARPATGTAAQHPDIAPTMRA